LSEQGFDPKALYALLGGLAAWEEAGLGVKP
jgi:rhodanese-related sulfurtransferase